MHALKDANDLGRLGLVVSMRVVLLLQELVARFFEPLGKGFPVLPGEGEILGVQQLPQVLLHVHHRLHAQELGLLLLLVGVGDDLQSVLHVLDAFGGLGFQLFELGLLVAPDLPGLLELLFGLFDVPLQVLDFHGQRRLPLGVLKNGLVQGLDSRFQVLDGLRVLVNSLLAPPLAFLLLLRFSLLIFEHLSLKVLDQLEDRGKGLGLIYCS